MLLAAALAIAASPARAQPQAPASPPDNSAPAKKRGKRENLVLSIFSPVEICNYVGRFSSSIASSSLGFTDLFGAQDRRDSSSFHRRSWMTRLDLARTCRGGGEDPAVTSQLPYAQASAR